MCQLELQQSENERKRLSAKPENDVVLARRFVGIRRGRRAFRSDRDGAYADRCVDRLQVRR